MNDRIALSRRRLLGHGALAISSTWVSTVPAWAQDGHAGHSGHAGMMPSAAPLPISAPGLQGDRIALTIGASRFTVGDRSAAAVSVNGSIPAPLIRLREGQTVRIDVTNSLTEQSSIHWHGLLVPFQMDGVPGVSFPGIDPGETFSYEFPVRQAGTYWYHSHSGMQEAIGLYGPIVIDPATPHAVPFDREYVIMLADWSPLHPHELLRQLKAMSGAFNMRRQTLAGLLAGKGQSAKDRLAWARMRMDPSDISDVTGITYRYLMNGNANADNWTAVYAPGERIRLRIINASAMTNFNFRLPGLAMTVVAADGLDVQPVETDEVQIAIAETYDVIVTPKDGGVHAIVAEALDRTGLVRGTLAPAKGMTAPIPPLRPKPLLTMRDMGMDMGSMDMGGTDMPMEGMDHGAEHAMPSPSEEGHHAMAHSMSMRDPGNAPGVTMGPGVAMIAPMPADRIADRPTGLEDVDHRVLTYADLRSAEPNPDRRAPSRAVEIHLTANMERYMWSMDGKALSNGAEPIPFRLGERVRVTLINDTMMPHPIHLHGHYFELVTGQPGHRPRKHTVNVLPGGKLSFDLTADGEGDWAFHCHMLLHMHAGMMRVVTVRSEGQA